MKYITASPGQFRVEVRGIENNECAFHTYPLGSGSGPDKYEQCLSVCGYGVNGQLAFAGAMCGACAAQWKLAPPGCSTTRKAETPGTLVQRITNYLAAGGLTNPEMANHNLVRDLLIDCRTALTAPACCEHAPGDHFVAPDRWTVCNRCSCVRKPQNTRK